MRRSALTGFLRRALGPANRASNFLQTWWVPVVALLGFALPLISLGNPHHFLAHVGRVWFVVAGVAALIVLLVRAGYQLEKERLERETPKLLAEFLGGHFNSYALGSQAHAGKYFQIEVQATRRLTGVRAGIVALRSWDPSHGQYVDKDLHARIPLAWSRTQELAIELRPGERRRCTVVLNQSHAPQVLFSTDNYEPTGVPFGLSEGMHEIDVLIDANEDVPGVTLSLTVDARRDWDRLNVGLVWDAMPDVETYPVERSELPPITGGTIPANWAGDDLPK